MKRMRWITAVGLTAITFGVGVASLTAASAETDPTLGSESPPPTSGLPQAQPTVLLDSAPGDHVGQGVQRQFDASLGDKVTATQVGLGQLQVDIDHDGEHWSIRLAQPITLSELLPGHYEPVDRAGDSAILDVSGAGRGCSRTSGSLDVRNVNIGLNGLVVLLDASFTQYCDGSSAPLKGEVLYSIQPGVQPRPSNPYLSFFSEYGDRVGSGRRQEFSWTRGDRIEARGSAAAGVTVSVNAGDWSLTLGGPTNDRLRTGRFSASRSGGTNTARLEFVGQGRGCNEVSGELDVRELRFESDGSIGYINAMFVQRCDGAPGQLIGLVEWGRRTPSLEINIDRPATLSRAGRSSLVTISGWIECRQASTVVIETTLTQKLSANRPVAGTGTLTVDCPGYRTPFTLAIPTGSRSGFVSGDALARATAVSNDSFKSSTSTSERVEIH